MNDVGKPCAREAHARFDGRGLETEPSRATAPVPDPTYSLALAAVMAGMVSFQVRPAMAAVALPRRYRSCHRSRLIEDPLWPALVQISRLWGPDNSHSVDGFNEPPLVYQLKAKSKGSLNRRSSVVANNGRLRLRHLGIHYDYRTPSLSH